MNDKVFTVEPLQILAFAFYEVFAFYCLAVKDNVGECLYPVTKEYASRCVAQLYINIHVTVTENEAVYGRVLLDIFTRKDDTVLPVFAKIWSITLHFVSHHTVLRPTVSHPDAPVGVYL